LTLICLPVAALFCGVDETLGRVLELSPRPALLAFALRGGSGCLWDGRLRIAMTKLLP
jgi:hypothetical protein